MCEKHLHGASRQHGEAGFPCQADQALGAAQLDGPIDRADLVKGYEVAKGEYILLTDDEIRSVKLESTKTIAIERFVPAGEIDRIR